MEKREITMLTTFLIVIAMVAVGLFIKMPLKTIAIITVLLVIGKSIAEMKQKRAKK